MNAKLCQAFLLLVLLLPPAGTGAPGTGTESDTSGATRLEQARLETRHGAVVLRTGAPGTAQAETLVPEGEIRHVDRHGRIHRPARRAENKPPLQTTLVVTEGAVMARPIGPIEAGMEARASARETSIRPIGRAGLRRLDRFMERLPRRAGLTEHDRAEITRITWHALGRLEALDADRLLEGVSLAARFADRPITWYEDLLRDLAPQIKRCRAALVLMDPVSPDPGRASARFVVSFELTPNLFPLETVTLAGSGWIDYEVDGDVWRITNGGIRAFNIDSRLLPPGFVRLGEIASSAGTK